MASQSFDERDFLQCWTGGWSLEENDKNKEAIEVYRKCLLMLPGESEKYNLYRTKLHINIAVSLEEVLRQRL